MFGILILCLLLQWFLHGVTTTNQQNEGLELGKEKKQVNNKWTLIKFSLLDGWTLKGYKKIGALDDEHKGIKAKNVTTIISNRDEWVVKRGKISCFFLFSFYMSYIVRV